jgi:hypothetical protein
MLRRLICLGSLLLLVAPAMATAQSDDVETAVRRAAKWLQDDIQKWRDERKCGTCHHAPMTFFTLSAAQSVPNAVNAEAFAEFKHWALTDSEARLLPQEPAAGTKPKLFLQTVYMSLGVNAVPETTPELTAVRQRLIQHLVSTQNEDGSWTGPFGRPPILKPPLEDTLLIATAWEPRRAEFPELVPMLDKAATWIEAQPQTDSHQELALRVMHSGLRSRGAASPRNSTLIAQLKSLQQDNGGWRQTANEPPDPYATGQSLNALRQAGVSADDPAIQRGVQFLLKTQQSDGSWQMTSRPHPENKSRAENLNPVTYAGSAWGLRGLLEATRE